MAFRIALPVVLATALFASAQEKIHTALTTDQIEQILKGMNLDYKKSAAPNAEGTYFYDFTHGKRAMRLHFFKGKDLMLDTLYKDAPLENVNRWNRGTKFNRAVVHRDPKGVAFVALESNIDLSGGVTENAVRRFIQTFEGDAGNFDRFLGVPVAEPPQIVLAGGDKIYLDVTTEKVESVLQSLNLTFKKQALKDGAGYIYDYQSRNYKIRLYNFKGKELMIDAVFEKQPLETINKYNFSEKFIRAVLHTPANGTEYTALAANLDCSAGVSDNMMRHFIYEFDGEVQSFVTFLHKK